MNELSKVVGYYARVGTEEAAKFLRLCDEAGITWYGGQSVYDFTPQVEVCMCTGGGSLSLSQQQDTKGHKGVKLKPFTIEEPTRAISVPFGTEYYVELDDGTPFYLDKVVGGCSP